MPTDARWSDAPREAHQLMRAVFMGTSAFAVPTLRSLAGGHDVALVVTQPDRPRGRGLRLTPPPIKEEALRRGLRVSQPERLGPAEVEEIAAARPEVIVVAAYGKILRAAVLGMPRLGCVNVHASILPRYRGAAPVVWAIVEGEHETGVTIMQMDEGLDSGPILLQQAVPIADDDTAGTLEARLSDLGATLLVDALGGLEDGSLRPRAQDHARATKAPRIRKEDAHVDFSATAARVRDRVRAMDPAPGAFALLEGQPLRLFGPTLVAEASGQPGTVLGGDCRGLLVACGECAVAFAELQLPGRRRLPAREVLRGRPIPSGARLS